MSAAVDLTSAQAAMTGAAQAIDPKAALAFHDDPVALTLIDGNIVYRRSESA
ncbi:hypothetical protein OLX02_17845 [Novosphingobium sp. KCTC 2891]|uniref:hypothetical protein n=1 Tax=Novosphingobium sp. KCTC 2891 TaxID=2989730 RepID=UPI002221B805|nr:hypothetical protein [Novosphingobium sp. KCTC 2891]MCW1384684.1 hypothetical protein [Novosphingobium sp. KCTC 2891]